MLRRLALVLLAASASPPARAQEENFVLRDVTRGVAVPTPHGVAGDFDVTSAVTNPAGLATLGGFALAFGSTRLAEARTVRGGGGWAAFLALPLTLPFKSGNPVRLTYGFSWQSVRAPETWIGGPADARTTNYGATYFLNSIGFGSSRASIGWTVASLTWDRTPENQGSTTHHVGVNLRPSRFLALGATLRDVFEPAGRSDQERFSRSSDLELALRPLGDWRVELAAGAVRGEDELLDLRGRLVARPLPGVALFGTVESVRRAFGAPGSRASRDLRALVGLNLDLRFGEEQETASLAYGLLTSEQGRGSAFAGSSVLAQISNERLPSLVEPPRFDRLELGGELDERDHLRHVVRLEELGRAGEVKGLLLVVPRLRAGWGRAEELREAVLRLRARGKRVIAYLEHAGMREIYLAAAADHVLLNPSAQVELQGIAAAQLYLRGALDKLPVEAQVLQIAEYKSAGEPFTRTGPSPAAREQLVAYLGDVHGRFVAEVARARGLRAEALTALLARAGQTPADAVAARLVDGIAYEDQIDDAISKLLGRKVRVAAGAAAAKRPTSWQAAQIAVVHVSGPLVATRGDDEGLFATELSASAVARAIREARESPQIRAIVLRVNSPGGGIQPSETIAREVERTRGRKPIVVSMGDVAASGGYWVSAHADAIFAPPSSLTGSIGVVTVKVNLGGLAARAGLAADVQKTAPHADMDSAFRPWTEEEAAGQLASMTYAYDRFVGAVARGRRLDEARVRAVARGRVWSGAQARAQGLVDETGGLAAALESAKRRAGLPAHAPVEVLSLPPRRTGVLDLLGRPPSVGASLPIPPALTAAAAAASPLLFYPPEPVARCPWAEGLAR
jgi:protease-4